MTNGNGITREIVAKLWNLCNVLRDDGITYTDYVTELTFLLFLKMLAETGHEERLPKEHRWAKLVEARRHRPTGVLPPAPARPRQSEEDERSGRPGDLHRCPDQAPEANQPGGTHQTQSTSSTGSPPEKKGSGTSTKGLLEKNAAEKKSGQGSTSRRVR